MPRNQIAKALRVNPNLLAFKPRQVVLLSNPPPIMKLDGANGDYKTLILNPEQETLLLHSVALYLQRRGFSKTLKKFLKEAKIQKDDLGDSSVHLEDIFSKFLDMCHHVSKNSKSQKVQELQTDGISRRDGGGDGKVKKTDKNVGDKATYSKNASEVITDDAVPVGVKYKEKKRNKNDSNSHDQEQVSTKILEEPEHGTNNKSKDEKRKKNKLSSDPIIDEKEPNKNDSKKDDFHSLKVDVSEKEDKSSKKRKRAVSEEDDVEPASEKLVEESQQRKKEKSKRRKTEVSNEPRIGEESTELTSTRIKKQVRKEDSDRVGFGESHKISAEQVNELSNGSVEENGEKGAIQETMKKQQNGSAEPKTVKHFQRVKVEEVAFSDERLKDNSYWAKDGAEKGFGAKAQEVLGQVRGRDFRHEKTKKKRGSYRGGQIDLHSHSVKFNYSDDD